MANNTTKKKKRKRDTASPRPHAEFAGDLIKAATEAAKAGRKTLLNDVDDDNPVSRAIDSIQSVAEVGVATGVQVGRVFARMTQESFEKLKKEANLDE